MSSDTRGSLISNSSPRPIRRKISTSSLSHTAVAPLMELYASNRASRSGVSTLYRDCSSLLIFQENLPHQYNGYDPKGTVVVYAYRWNAYLTSFGIDLSIAICARPTAFLIAEDTCFCVLLFGCLI